jgi:hypothetical protein
MLTACHLVLARLRTACPMIHATRVRGLLTAVETDTHHQRLTLTELGRGLRSPTLVKPNIKRIDRFLGNSRLGTGCPSFKRSPTGCWPASPSPRC